MQPSAKSLPSRKAVISTVASVAATVMVAQSLTREFIPRELRTYLFTKFSQFLSTLTNEITLIIDEYDGLTRNQLFYAAEVYLGTINSPSITTFRASLPEKEEKINVSVAKYEEIIDRFCGLRLKWMMGSQKNQAVHHFANSDGSRPSIRSDLRLFKLTFNKNHKSKVIDEYLPYILERSRAVKEEKKTLKLHTLKGDKMHGGGGPMWQAVNLDHPASFDTLAMDDEIKKMIVDDLDRFVKRKEFYRKLGKAWKRGYLLFGPPGTGKSSMIAAMSNYLNFDIYDLELTDIRCNSDLRRLLISTTNRSILVVEDIDASIDLSQRKATAPAKPPRGSPPYQYDQEPKVTLSGILNFIDGLWSSCGDERIIIFTTNHKDKLDPALLRPGRMDVHIHMSYCTPCGFKMLLNSYLGMTEHTLMLEAEGLIASTKVTPAEVGEQLLKTDNPELALQGLINFLEHKKECERVAEENLEVNKMEVGVEEKEEEEEERGEKLSVVKGHDKLKDLIKRSRASSTEMGEKTVKMEEVATALKILFKFLESKNGMEGKSDADTTSSGETVPEAGKSDATKDE